jgi:hypothetical protein
MKSLAISVLLFAALTAAPQIKATDVPADFSAEVTVVTAIGTSAGTLKIHIDRYSTDRERTTLLTALRTNGYQTFLPALRKMPVVGYLQIKDAKFDLKWAAVTPRDLGAHLTLATDQPVFFAGGGAADPKPRAGYEMSVTEMDIDTIGMGKGTFAGAARVKPSANGTGVEVDAYADQPSELTMITRAMK